MTPKRLVVPALLVALVLVAGTGPVDTEAQPEREWYAAPDGRRQNDGSRTAPIDLASALDGDRIGPGSTVWLAGGTYRGPLTSTLTGTPTAPIVVRGLPGARAIVVDDRERAVGATMNVRGGWTTYRDFEVTNSNSNRRHATSFRPMGFEVEAPNTKFVNLTIYDTGMGFGFWKGAANAELYGNVIFNSGTENTAIDGRHGHGIYTQNDDGTKLVRDNLLVNQFGLGIHAYPNPGGLVGLRFEGNVIADSGAANESGVARYNNLLVSGYRPYRADRIEIIANYTYLSPRRNLRGVFNEANICLGCSDQQTHGQAMVRDNYFAGGAPVALVYGWQRLTMRGNTFIGMDGMAVIRPPSTAALSAWNWDDNEYIGQGPPGDLQVLFAVDGRKHTRETWTSATGFDKTSRFRDGRPVGTKVFVRPNEHEPGRAHVIVYNWDRLSAVPADLSQVLRTGDRYEMRNGMDFLGDPVLVGVFDGKPVAVPMTGLRVVEPRGAHGTASETRGEFAVFVVRLAARESPSQARTTAPASVDAEGLSPFIGRYVSRKPASEIRVRLAGGRLVLENRDEPGKVYTLVPVSERRFRIQGAPEGYFATFQSTGGLQSLKVERGSEVVVLVKE